MIGASVVFALAAVALLSSTADAQPLLPMQLSGTLTVDGNPAPENVPISARLRQGSFTITFKSTLTRSDGTYLFNVPADDTSTTVKDGFIEGDTVLVFVEDQEVTSVTFFKGAVVTENLSVDSLEAGTPATPTPVPTSAPAVSAPSSSVGSSGSSAGADTTPPSAPTGLSATTSPGQVALSWDKNHEADFVLAYNVERSESGGLFFLLSQTSGTVLIDTMVSNGVEYTYQVRAADAAGNLSQPSASVSVTLVAATPTPTPSPTPTPTPVLTGTPTAPVTPATATPKPTETATPETTPVPRAEIIVRDLSVSPRVLAADEPIEISATVANTGGKGGLYSVSLQVSPSDDGLLDVDTRTGVLLPGESIPLLFTVSRATPGDYAVSIGSLADAFTVVKATVNVSVETDVAISDEATATDAAGNTVAIFAGRSSSVTADTVSLPIQLPTGTSLGGFTDQVSGISVDEEGTVTIPLKDDQGNTQINLVIKTAGLTGTGTSATGTVTSIALESPAQEVDLTDQDSDLGNIVVTVNADLNALPENARVKMTPKATLPQDVQSEIELLAQAGATTIVAIGGTIEVETTNLPNGAHGVGIVTVCIGVGEAWVQRNTGNTFKFGHTTTDAEGNIVQELLDATQQGALDAEGRVVFCGESNGFSSYALIAVAPLPANLQIGNLVIDPAVPAVGEVLSISVEVTNTGAQSATRSVVLRINDQALARKDVTVEPGTTESVVFLQLAPERQFTVEIGELTATVDVSIQLGIADVRITDLTVNPAEHIPGGTVTVRATVENISDRAGAFDVLLSVDDVPDSRITISLDPGESRTVAFGVTRRDEKEYRVAIGSAIDTFVIRLPVVATPTPTPPPPTTTPTPSPATTAAVSTPTIVPTQEPEGTPQPTPEPEPTATQAPLVSPEEGEEPGGFSILLLLVIAVLVIGAVTAVAIVIQRRQPPTELGPPMEPGPSDTPPDAAVADRDVEEQSTPADDVSTTDDDAVVADGDVEEQSTPTDDASTTDDDVAVADGDVEEQSVPTDDASATDDDPPPTRP